MFDPIVEEIHQIREKLLAECGGDLNKLLDRYKAAEEQDRDRLADPQSVLKKKSKQEPQAPKSRKSPGCIG